MSGGSGGPFLRLLDLALRQKAAVEAGNLEEAVSLGDQRDMVFNEIRKACSAEAGGKPHIAAGVVRQILSADEAAAAIVRMRMRETTARLERINTFKVLCQGISEEQRFRNLRPTP